MPDPIPPEDIDRSPPHDSEFEEALLGELLLFPDEAWEACSGVLGWQDFYSGRNQQIARLLMEAIEDGHPHDALTLRRAAKKVDGADDFVVAIMDAAPTGGNIPAHVDRLKRLAMIRGVINAGEEFKNEGQRAALNGCDVAGVLASHRVRVDDLEREAGGNTLKPISMSDLVKMDIPIPPPLVGPGLIRVGDFGSIAAEEWTGKTYLGMDLCLRLAAGTGGQWVGYEVAKGDPIPVVWLWGEGGYAKAIERSMKLTGGKDIPEAFYFWAPDMFAPDLASPVDVARVRNMLDRVKERHRSPHVVLVVDPKSEFWVGDESVGGQVFIRSMKALVRKCNATVIVLDHTRKRTLTSQKGSAREIRGDTKFPAAYDFVLMLEKRADGHITATWAKAKDAGRVEPLVMRLNSGTPEEPGDFRFKVVGEVGEKVSAPMQVQDALTESADLGRAWMTKPQLKAATGLGDSTLQRALNTLAKQGLIEDDGTKGGSLKMYRLVAEGGG